ncbi:MAG TPA: DUF4386 domain-containing protein [Anaerolineales bacterium]|nr:DUF4386 domain-containing protein [Anaerolineales bacterium]
MRARTIQTSPQIYARIGGVLYLITIVLGAVEELFVRGRIVVPGDTAATAANLRSMESLWRFGIASELFLGICTIALTLILYVLLKPVNRELALLATFFSLIAIAVETAYSLQLVEALYPLGNAVYLKAFTPEQLYAMSSLSIRAHGDGFGIALLFFGCFFPIAGYLIFKSGYFPKAIGILYMIPGLSYLMSSFALILAPTFAGRFYFVIAGPALIGEASLCLWLLLKGVNLEKWEVLALESA